MSKPNYQPVQSQSRPQNDLDDDDYDQLDDHNNHSLNPQLDDDDGSDGEYYEDDQSPVRSLHPSQQQSDNQSMQELPRFTGRSLSLSSRHSESHPFDQDVRHPSDQPISEETPSDSQKTNPAIRPSNDQASKLQIPTMASIYTKGPLTPTKAESNVQPTAQTDASLKKSSSVPSMLAGRAFSLAAEGTRRFDRALRGQHDNHAGDFVEDHVLETLDYESAVDNENELALELSGSFHSNYLLMLKVLMMITIGFVTAMLMFVVSNGVSLIYGGKISATRQLLEDDNPAGAYFAFLFMNLAITGVASSLVAILAPHARGGGVPYALSYLNGTNVIEYFSPRIVAVKTVALIFTIAGGLTLGMEGPFVFIGGGVALLCSRAIDWIFPFLFIGRQAKRRFGSVIRNIREERIFMAGGLAAGLAVAFDAPIAGILFALEGSTTFLTVPTVLRIFGCAMFASFFNDLGHTHFSNEIINHNLIAPTPEAEHPPWAFSVQEVLPFTVLGLLGGLFGAGGVWVNIQISHWRHHALAGNSWKTIGKQIAEIAVFTLATSTIWFVLPFIFGCRQVGPQCLGEEGEGRCPRLHCSEGSYSDIGAFVYSSSDEIGRMLFDRSLSYDQDYRAGPLVAYGLAYWILVALIYGAYVPGGLFVPSIVVGGVYGRVFGIFVEYLFPSSFINPGVYALLGASSMLGGFTRLALPVVLMLIELTGDATYLLPIMYTAFLGKFIADFLFPPLYPQHMRMEGIPTLTDQLPPALAKLCARDIMIHKKRLACMKFVEKLSVLQETLKESKRSMFPLVTHSGELVGLCSRQAVLGAVRGDATSFSTAHEAEKYGGVRDPQLHEVRKSANNVDWHDSTLTHNDSISLQGKVSNEFVNLAPFADCGLITVSQFAPTQRCAGLFRRLGMSHLCVTDSRHRFLGFITRRCLLTAPGAQPESVVSHPPSAPEPVQVELSQVQVPDDEYYDEEQVLQEDIDEYDEQYDDDIDEKETTYQNRHEHTS